MKVMTAVAQTVEALPSTSTPTVPILQSYTSTPRPCNIALFIEETIPDGTKFAKGEAFTKTWRFKNMGTCTWNTNYKLLFISGDQMGAQPSKNFEFDVAPSEMVDISIDLIAPTNNGIYIGNFKLVDDNGQEFANILVMVEVNS